MKKKRLMVLVNELKLMEYIVPVQEEINNSHRMPGFKKNKNTSLAEIGEK